MTSLRYSMQLQGGGVISIVGAGGKTALMYRLARELASHGDRVLTTTTTKIRMPMQRQSSIVLQCESVENLLKKAKFLGRRCRHITAGRQFLHFQNKLKGFPPGAIDRIWQSGVFRWIIVEADGAAGKPLKAPAEHEPVIPDSTRWLIAVVGLTVVGKALNARWVFRPQLVSAISGLAPNATISAGDIAKMCLDQNGMLKNAPRQARRFIFLNQADSHKCLASGKRIAQLLILYGQERLNRVLIGQTIFEPTVAEYHIIS